MAQEGLRNIRVPATHGIAAGWALPLLHRRFDYALGTIAW